MNKKCFELTILKLLINYQRQSMVAKSISSQRHLVVDYTDIVDCEEEIFDLMGFFLLSLSLLNSINFTITEH